MVCHLVTATFAQWEHPKTGAKGEMYCVPETTFDKYRVSYLRLFGPFEHTEGVLGVVTPTVSSIHS